LCTPDNGHYPRQQESIVSVCLHPAALLREARRQKGLPGVEVPPVCVLDPDGDIVRSLRRQGMSKPFPGWACYHTEMDAFDLAKQTAGNMTIFRERSTRLRPDKIASISGAYSGHQTGKRSLGF
jgi:hypothetical protein